jgi:hypothetical protein
MSLDAVIEGIGLAGPGLKSWTDARAILSGAAPHAMAATDLPQPISLPPSERRRASRATKLVLAVGLEAAQHAGSDPSSLATVFASSCGDGYNCHEICQQLAGNDRQLSPTRFHNSVHNAPAGYWGIASGSMAPSSVICAHDGSFAAGLLEAIAYVRSRDERCLLIAHDTDYPEPLRATRPTPDAFGIALVIAPKDTGRALASISVMQADDAANPLATPSLETLRCSIPAARGLPLLAAIARGAPGPVIIEYLDDRRLAIDLRVN